MQSSLGSVGRGAMIDSMTQMKDCLIVSNFAPHSGSGCRNRKTNQNSQRSQTLTPHFRICYHGKQGRARQFLGTKPKNCEGHLEHSMSPFRTQSNVRQLGGGARSQKCVCLTLNACTGFQQQLYQHPVPRGDGNKQGCGATLASVLERWRCLPSANNACPYHHKPTCPNPTQYNPTHRALSHPDMMNSRRPESPSYKPLGPPTTTCLCHEGLHAPPMLVLFAAMPRIPEGCHMQGLDASNLVGR